jgi:hypothetical protein
MTKNKKFDCVQMKCDIQRKLMEEEEGMTVEERIISAEKKIRSNPILGPWFQKIRRKSPVPAMVAESRAAYGKK